MKGNKVGSSWIAIISLAVVATVNAVTVDFYQAMENGADGDLLTTKLMEASSHGGYQSSDTIPAWTLTGSMWVSTSHARPLPGIVTVNGKNYAVTSSRTWKFSDTYEWNFVTAQFGTERRYNNPPYHDRMTVACYYTPGQTNAFSNNHDNIGVGYPLLINGKEVYGVFQTTGDPSGGPYCRVHTELGDQVSDKIKVTAGKTYWINLHYDGIAGTCSAAVFDPDGNWAQIGATVSHEAVPNSKVNNKVKFGRTDKHGDNTSWPNETFTYISHIMVDYTEAKFPLLPDTAKSTPVRTIRPSASPKLVSFSKNGFFYNLDHAASVTVSLINANGVCVSTLVSGHQSAGTHTIAWNAIGLPKGLYVVTINAGNEGYYCQKAVLF